MTQKKASISLMLATALAICAFVLLSLTPGNAAYAQSRSSVPHPLLKGTVHSIPAANPADNMVYGGGPVMTGNVKVFLIFWQPAGHTFTSPYKSLLQRFFTDFGQSSTSPRANVFGVIHQYKNSSGQSAQTIGFGGAFTDTRAYPRRGFVIDSDLHTEVRRVSSSQHWAVSFSSIFFVYTTADEVVCFDASRQQCSDNVFCAYHESFNSGGKTFLYGSIPDERGCGIPASPNGDTSSDGSIDASSHEVMEAMSDAEPNSGWSNNNVGEIGDPCAHTYGPMTGPGRSDMVLNGHPYLIQPEWNNRVSGCSMNP